LELRLGVRRNLIYLVLLLLWFCFSLTEKVQAGYYFPPPGQTLTQQNLQIPQTVGLNQNIIIALQGKASRWALWRHGYLVHVEGDFNQTQEVKSLRKTWHALTVGAAVKLGKIPDFKIQKISVYQTNLSGKDANATWRHVITQSAGFDYPGCGDNNDYNPGEMWTYSDLNLKNLNEALFKVWGNPGGSYTAINYKTVLNQAYFTAIGMQGWNTQLNADGIRLILDLEDMGRLGLLMLARGKWDGVELIPQWFVEEQETKQTAGMQVNYNGCNDGVLNHLNKTTFPESPYGYLTWTNSAGDFYKGASTVWSWGAGAGGTFILWNNTNGIVFTAVGADDAPKTSGGIPHIIEANITGPNPLYEGNSLPPSPSVVPSSTPKPSSSPSIAPSPSPNPADADGDGDADTDDFKVWIGNYGKLLNSKTNGDFSLSGKVNLLDYSIWLNNR